MGRLLVGDRRGRSRDVIAVLAVLVLALAGCSSSSGEPSDSTQREACTLHSGVDLCSGESGEAAILYCEVRDLRSLIRAGRVRVGSPPPWFDTRVRDGAATVLDVADLEPKPLVFARTTDVVETWFDQLPAAPFSREELYERARRCQKDLTGADIARIERVPIDLVTTSARPPE